MSVITGYAGTDKTTPVEPVTLQPFDRSRIALDVSPQFEYSVQTGLAQTSNGTTTVINVASHSAFRGDRITCFTGTNAGQWGTVLETTATTITVAQPFSAATQAGDTFNVFRPIRARTNSAGDLSVSGSFAISGPFASGDPYLVPDAVAVGVQGQYSIITDSFGNTSRWLPVGGFDPRTTFPTPYPMPVINSGDDVSVAISDNIGNALTSGTSAPTGSERGLHVRQVGSVDTELPKATVTTGNITALAQTVEVTLDGQTSVAFSIRGTYTSVAIIFEGRLESGTWFTIEAKRSDGNTIETASGTISSTARLWRAGVAGLGGFRVRATAFSSGTASIEIARSFGPVEPFVGVASHAVTLTSTTLTAVTPGTAAANLGKAVDSAVGATDTGVAALVQRVDTPAAITPANNDYTRMIADSFGRLWVRAEQGTGTWVTRMAPITWGTVTRTTVTTTAATAAASNANRRALSLWNESGGALHWTFNGTASATNYQGILYSGDGIVFKGDDNSTQALSVVAGSGTVTYTVCEAT